MALIWAGASALGEPAREPSGRERGREERRVLTRAAAHVVERQACACLLPALDRHFLGGEPLRPTESFRPCDVDGVRARVDDRTSVVGDTAMARARIALRVADREDRSSPQ